MVVLVHLVILAIAIQWAKGREEADKAATEIAAKLVRLIDVAVVPSAGLDVPVLQVNDGLLPDFAWRRLGPSDQNRFVARKKAAPGEASALEAVGVLIGPDPDFNPSTLDGRLFGDTFLQRPVLWYLTEEKPGRVKIEALAYYKPDAYDAKGRVHLWVQAPSREQAQAMARALAQARLEPAGAHPSPAAKPKTGADSKP